MDLKDVAPIIAALAAFIVACLAAYFTFLNAEIQKRRKRSDLYKLLEAEITNLERHSRIVSREIKSAQLDAIAQIKTTKYKDGSMLLFDVKESYLLNGNICQDLMQLSLLSRNNDIYIDELIEKMKSENFSQEKFEKYTRYIQNRMEMTTRLCAKVLENLDKFAKNPSHYREPIINW